MDNKCIKASAHIAVGDRNYWYCSFRLLPREDRIHALFVPHVIESNLPRDIVASRKTVLESRLLCLWRHSLALTSFFPSHSPSIFPFVQPVKLLGIKCILLPATFSPRAPPSSFVTSARIIYWISILVGSSRRARVDWKSQLDPPSRINVLVEWISMYSPRDKLFVSTSFRSLTSTEADIFVRMSDNPAWMRHFSFAVDLCTRCVRVTSQLFGFHRSPRDIK